MARPKKNLPPVKDKKITIRLTDEMYDVLESEANAAGLTTSEYARKLLLDNRPVVKQEIVYDCEELLHILGDMGKIGSNLNQIAHFLNGGNPFDSHLKSEVMQGIIALYKIRDAAKAIAGEYRGNH